MERNLYVTRAHVIEPGPNDAYDTGMRPSHLHNGRMAEPIHGLGSNLEVWVWYKVSSNSLNLRHRIFAGITFQLRATPDGQRTLPNNGNFCCNLILSCLVI